ncbi:MAG: phytoene/squalene synthase family protein [Woronichinia naegeliana WA131]|jgi:farnesyl-diphosphate farnesyltransferase|uniref:Phytoene/squalene synthase family protein n=1 Tax=Woronichinia naegeliana WA131 TaxID=2824559 RepID=A0A977KYC1_9CYAN|nr:MAG: phytoene/squalene synthase family protein [Woronichinia naegeliana WA131]
MNLRHNALEVLKETSRTFYIPISILPAGLLEAVAGAYLCMRAIDEVEDHSELDNFTKAKILRQISLNLQAATEHSTLEDFAYGLSIYRGVLPDVTLRVGEWAMLAPESIAPRVWDATAAMADRMANWSTSNWEIETEADLDQYTFSVAGAVGLLLSDLWAWHDGTQTNRTQAIGFGRGLQAVNIVRNYREDLQRGVSFFPKGWRVEDMHQYARRNLKLADQYTKSLPNGPAQNFCKIPLTLAYGTLEVLALGKDKLSRSDVMALVNQATR